MFQNSQIIRAPALFNIQHSAFNITLRDGYRAAILKIYIVHHHKPDIEPQKISRSMVSNSALVDELKRRSKYPL